MSEEAVTANTCKAKRTYLIMDGPTDDTPWMLDDPVAAGAKLEDRLENGCPKAHILEVIIARKVKIKVKKEIILETDLGDA